MIQRGQLTTRSCAGRDGWQRPYDDSGSDADGSSVGTVLSVPSDNRIEQQHEVWEDWARADPFWAILSDPARRDGGWRRSLPKFFASGFDDVEAVFAALEQLNVDVPRGRALDFGCGVGRLTQALAARFAQCDGVDISETMVELARRYNRHPDLCEYHQNVHNDLSMFADETFDLVLTLIVLQHNPPDLAERYISEFLRVLTPRGVAVFDMPAHIARPELAPGSHRADLTLVKRPKTVRSGEAVYCAVSVVNTSGLDWPAGSQLSLGNHWARPDGTVEILDDARCGVTGGLAAGAEAVLQLRITPPATPGRYHLQVDMVEEGVTWFAKRGSSIASVTVHVGPPRRTIREFVTRARPVREVEPAGTPALFTTHALPRDRIEQVVVENGGRIIDVSPIHSAGVESEAYRYVVGRGAPAQRG